MVAYDFTRILRQVGMPCHKPHYGNEFTTTAELPGVGLSTAVVGHIAQHLYPHFEDHVQPVVSAAEHIAKSYSGVVMCRRI
jgi:hypothetical protein